MRRTSLAALASLGLAVAAFSFALPASAAGSPTLQVLIGTTTPFSGGMTFEQDAISARDQAEYQKDDFAGRFGVAFRPHIAVCDTSSMGSAACDARVVTDDSGTPQAAAAPSLGYGPAQFLEAYGLSGKASSAMPPVIAIVDAYGDANIQSDLNSYSSAFGIPTLPSCSGAVASSAAPCFEKVNEQGTTSYPATNSSWSLETSLDVEVAHGTCQNCSILLVEASSNSYSDLMAAEDRAVALGADVVSNSYGSPEFSGESAYDSNFNHPGIAFTFSAGDGGYGVEYPAASPYVTAVGGTSLFLNANGSYDDEVAWSGTGSGCSTYEPKPSWQADTGCANRTDNDVSADADPNTGAAVYDSVRYDGESGWFEVGGTSLASPLIAATYAQAGVASGVADNSFPYSQGNASDLHDVTSGSNGACGGSYLCTSLLGYDGPTGLGTPLGTGAFSASTSGPPPPPPPPPLPTVSVSASPSSITLGQSSTLSWSSTNASSCVASGSWTGTEATAGSQSVTPSATGTSTYTLACSGAAGTATSSAAVSVGAAPVQGFTISANPSSSTVSPGSGASYALTLNPSGGFTGSVALFISSTLPSGVTAQFSTNRRSSSSGTLELSTSRKTVAGTYSVTIEGQSGSLTSTVGVTLIVR